MLIEHRAAFRLPLAKATTGLRSAVRTEGCEVEVSQRLKRMTTIIDKLMRQPTMAPANMQDIAGCRAVLADIHELRRVQRRVSKNRPPLRADDYIVQPRASGYRGVHLIIQYDDRSIEVQLRTRVMHEWAVTVERLGGRIGEDLKSGYGTPELLNFFQAVSQAMAIEEVGQVVDTILVGRIIELRRLAQPFLTGGQT